MRLLICAGVVVAMAMSGPARAGEDWYPSKYGPDDEIGAANLLTPQRVLEAAKLVKTGKVYGLGIETSSETPAFPPRGWKVYIVQPDQIGGATLGHTKTSYNDDIVEGWFGVGTQIDGLGHLGIDNVYYNGNKAADFAKSTGLTKLGVEKIPPIVTRGVLLDIAGLRGVDRLEAGEAINRTDIDAALEKQGLSIGEGDVVLLHTGWMNMLDEDPVAFTAGEPGLGREGATYLASLGVVAVGGDSFAMEAVPHEDGAGQFEVHQILLAKNGVYILENIDTRQLAADGAHEFLFVLSAPRVTGAVQMIVNPVAIR
ncbi:MAG: cyclase family protein [Alphaproteobacteria bacterium]